VLSSSRDVAYRLDLKTLTYDYVGDASQSLMGYAPEQLAALGFTGVAKRFHPDDLKRLDAHFSRLLAGDVEMNFSPVIEYRWKCRDGNYRWFSDSRSLVCDEAGRPFALVGAVRDITDPKQAEQALRDSEAKHRGLIESIPVGMCQIDTAVGGRIIMANPAAARMFGYDSTEQVMEARLDDLLPSTRQRRQMLKDILTTGQIVGKEIQAIRRDGKRLWVAATVRAVRGPSGDVRHFDALLEDITERKLASQAIQEAHRKLFNAREAERRRLATELHDSLGQSLVVLNLEIQSAYVGHDSDFDPARLAALKSVANRCNALIEEVRHICHGLFPPVLEALGLEAALRGVARDCQGRAEASLDCPEDLAGCRFAEEVEIVLFRIAQEAVQNALRHSQADTIQLALSRTNGRVRLTVTDNGRGFDIRSAGVGGLGLTTMRERAKAVDGILQIDSQPGRTRVSIEVDTPVFEPEGNAESETGARQ